MATTFAKEVVTHPRHMRPFQTPSEQKKQLIKKRKAAGIKDGHDLAWQKHSERAARKPIVDELTRKTVTVPSAMTPAELVVVRETRPRVQRWVASRNASVRSAHHTVREIDNGRYSGRCTYKKIDHAPLAWAMGWITCTGRYLVYQYGPKQTVLKAPRGWTWGEDGNGLYVRDNARTTDYHPSAADLNDPERGVKWCVERARELGRTRTRERRAAKQDAIIAKQGEALLRQFPAYACVADSQRSGNCLTGTLAWVMRNRIDATHVPVDTLAVSGDSQVQRVVQSATKRHLRELVEGVCFLSDHTPVEQK